MAEPDNLVLEILGEIRADIRSLDERVNARIDHLTGRVDHLSEQVEGIDTRLNGLTHAVVAGFGVFVNRMNDAETRLARLERDRT